MKMKKAITKKKLLLILVLNLTLTAAALPPDVEADRLLVRAEQFINNNNFAQAASTLEEILTLQQQHNLEIPVDFYFKYAEIVLNSDDQERGEKAYLAVTHYLETAGRAGEHYQQALELYNQASVLHSQEIGRNLIDEINGEARLEIVRQLIANGADVNAVVDVSVVEEKTVEEAVEEEINTYSLEHHDVALVTDFIIHERSGRTLLHLAAHRSNNPQIIGALIAAGANVNAKSENSQTPLHLAPISNNPQIIGALIAAGANVNAKSENSQTPLHLAAHRSNNPQIIEALIAAGANVNVADDPWSPLHLAARFSKNPQIIEALIAAGANVNENYPIHRAVYNPNPEIIEALIAAGANVNAVDYSGDTPLHLAAHRSNNPQIIEALIAAGANVNVADNRGQTPLHHAVEDNENPEITKALIAAGANVRAKDDRGDRPLDVLGRNSMNSSDKETVERWLRRPRLLR